MSVHHFFANSSKIPAKGSTKWLELITKILNFLQIFTVTKSTTQLCNISENLQESHQKNYISDNSCGYLHSLFLPGSNKCFFYMFSTICLVLSYKVFSLITPLNQTTLQRKQIGKLT